MANFVRPILVWVAKGVGSDPHEFTGKDMKIGLMILRVTCPAPLKAGTNCR